MKTIFLKSKFGIHAFRQFNWRAEALYEEVTWFRFILYKITGIL